MMTEAKLNAYVMRVYPITSMVGNAAVYTILTLILLVALLAWLIPMKKDLHTGDEKIFHVPFEIAIATGITGISLIFSYLGARERKCVANRFSGLVCFLCSHVLGIRLCTPDPASWSKGICEKKSSADLDLEKIRKRNPRWYPLVQE